ncbi:PP2C family protein-serine/threonine phosphatase [Lutibaculum baratangense]|uniref:HAMP domain-containing protein n=1 Tax=Lutibaculum baratangense AMV1 TaxID=631454 RepID=V4RPG2_9HYPH|nr:SpoIIE family protein phosphatase [Lutibaculum baratangense]ESR27169.1 hypothetical protein N177_0148 [Lutibaculum baratangense AMV1]
MKIRHTLFALTLFLGLSLVAVLAVDIKGQIDGLRDERKLFASNAIRAELLLASAALARERTQAYLNLLSPGRFDMDAARSAVNDSRDRIVRALREHGASLPGLEAATEAVGELDQLMEAARAEVDRLLASDAAGPRRRGARQWFERVTGIIEQTQALRISLLSQDIRQDPVIRSEGRARYYASIFAETVAQNQALIGGALLSEATVARWVSEQAERNFGRGGLAIELLRSEAGMLPDPELHASLASLGKDDLAALLPLLATLHEPWRERSAAISLTDWLQLTSATLAEVDRTQARLLASSRERLGRDVAEARRRLGLWAAFLLAAVFAVLASHIVLRDRVVAPLESTIAAMLRLARNDLDTPLPHVRANDEFGAMGSALRTFKANAIHRDRLERNRADLHARLKETYRLLRQDLQAAAAIQSTLLPRASDLGQVSFDGAYHPASVVAGDTYNVLRQRDDHIGFFQVDVAGHGAPAALGSVVSHHTLSQAILKRRDGGGLNEVAAEIDAAWPEDLPYFTMILGEVDCPREQLHFVQAGHPSPVLLEADGSFRTLGDGGLPVGLVPEAEFEIVTSPFRPGDRLLVHSDGVTEAAGPAGEIFGEERLMDVVSRHRDASTRSLIDAVVGAVREWRGSGTFEDDVSLLVIERTGRKGGCEHDQP